MGVLGGAEKLSDVADRYPEDAPVGNLVGIVLGREANGSNGETGARTVALIDAMYRAARTGERVDVPAAAATAGRTS